MHVASLHRCVLHRSYEVAGFLKKNKDPFYDDIKDCLKASALPFVAMLITTDFDKAYLGSPRSIPHPFRAASLQRLPPPVPSHHAARDPLLRPHQSEHSRACLGAPRPPVRHVLQLACMQRSAAQRSAAQRSAAWRHAASVHHWR
jgi:hypothetical protein